MRRRNVKNAHERLIARNDICFESPNVTGDIWQNLVKDYKEVKLEIGCGKGKFIVELAKQNPSIFYIGLEKYESVIIEAVDKVAIGELPNLRFICGDATLLEKYFLNNMFSTIYLNFSDPWPKNKHTKRRLTYKLFLEKYESLLITNGTIEFKTDNRGLFEYSLESFNENNWHFIDLSLDLHQDKTNIVTTEYEDKFSSKGNVIYFVELDKRKL